MDLDERLREILEAESASEKYEKEIAQIKQAFEDEIMPMVNHIDNLANDALTKAENLMTGSEWYERFEKEVEGMGMEPPIIDGAYLDAARIASGIDKEGCTCNISDHEDREHRKGCKFYKKEPKNGK